MLIILGLYFFNWSARFFDIVQYSTNQNAKIVSPSFEVDMLIFTFNWNFMKWFQVCTVFNQNTQNTFVLFNYDSLSFDTYFIFLIEGTLSHRVDFEKTVDELLVFSKDQIRFSTFRSCYMLRTMLNWRRKKKLKNWKSTIFCNFQGKSKITTRYSD